MLDISLQELLMRIPCGFITIATQELVQTWAIRLLKRDLGVQVFDNHVPYFSWLGLISYIIALKGWSSSLGRNLDRFSNRVELLWVVLAGWLALFVLICLSVILRPLALNIFTGNVGIEVVNFLNLLISGGIWTFLWSLIPLPPLSGFVFLIGILAVRCKGVTSTRITFAFEVVLLVIAASGWLNAVLQPMHNWIFRWLA
jgi:hypothetical protein